MKIFFILYVSDTEQQEGYNPTSRKFYNLIRKTKKII